MTTPIASATPLPVSELHLQLGGADDRKLAERAVEDALLLLGITLQHVAEHGHEHQQQREQRHEAVVGDQRRELAGLVVAELLDHRGDEAQAPAALLVAVEGVEAVGEGHLGSFVGMGPNAQWREPESGRGVQSPLLATCRCAWPIRSRTTGRRRARGARARAPASRPAAGVRAGCDGKTRRPPSRAPLSTALGGSRGLLRAGHA